MRNALLAIGLLAGAALMAGAQPAGAVVVCKYVGVPKGCVATPGVVLKPAPVVYCKYVGVPKGCVVRPGVVLRPAPRRVIRRGGAINRGGPVNRVGPR
jgi:hypothetical protein